MKVKDYSARTKKIVLLGLLSAIALAVVIAFRIPIVLFLKYEPKGVIIAIGGFLYGPLAAFIITTIVSIIEMFTISSDGIIGLIMNIFATGAFACTAAFVYKRKHTLTGAFFGLVLGSIAMTIIMLIWNYVITPYYMGIPREEVVALLVPAILPFNLLKGGLNTGLTMLLYKPISTALRKAGLLPSSAPMEQPQKKLNLGLLLLAAFILITCILLILAINNIL